MQTQRGKIAHFRPRTLPIARRHAAGRPLLVLSAVVVLLTFALASSSAQASKNVVGYFGSEGLEQGQFWSAPQSLAVNETGSGSDAAPGDVYASDRFSVRESNGSRSGRVDQFDADGKFLRTFGWDVVAAGPDNTGTDEQQAVSVSPGAIGGTFRLTLPSVSGDGAAERESTLLTNVSTYAGEFQAGQTVQVPNFPPNTTIAAVGAHTLRLSKPAELGGGAVSIVVEETTTPLPFDVTAEQLRTALEALPGIGVGGVAVTGGPGASGTPLTVTFTGGRRLDHSNVPTMTVTSSIVGGAATVATTVEGGGPETCNPSVDVCKPPVEPPDESVSGNLPFFDLALAVDQTNGSVYASGNRRISIFGSDGTYEAAFGYGVQTGGSELEFCTTSCKEGSKFLGGIMATDPTTGNLYTEVQHGLDEYHVDYNGSGQPIGVHQVAAMGWGVATGAEAFEVCTVPTSCKPGLEGEGLGEIGSVESIAVNSAGVVYLAESPAYPKHRVQTFTPGGGGTFTPAEFAPSVLTDSLEVGHAPRQMAIGPGGHVFVLDDLVPSPVTTCFNGLPPAEREDRLLEFDASGTKVDTHLTCAGYTFEGESFLTSLIANPATGSLYIGAGLFHSGENDARVLIINDLESPTDSVESLTAGSSGATITGVVEPHGPSETYPNFTKTSYQLEYKLSAESSWTKFGAPIPVGAGSGAHHVTVRLGGLEANKSYDVRLVAFKPGEPAATSAPETFHTAPIAPTIGGLSSKGVTAHSADLLAKVDPHGLEATYHFEYGPSASYGQETPELPVGESFGTVPLEIHIEGLSSSVYHFRVVAHSAAGSTVSSDQTFTFFPEVCPNGLVRQQTGSEYLPDCRAYELVSPPDAGNILFKSAFAKPAPYATDPPRFLYAGLDGSIAGTESVNANSADAYVATRTSTGWVSTYPGIPGSQTSLASYGMGDLTLSKFINYDNETEGNAPFVYDVNDNFLERWPSDVASVPGGEQALGAFQPSPDLSHMAFSTQTDFDPNSDGLSVAPGSAYDYDVADHTTTLISRTASGDIPQDPNRVEPSELILFAGMRDFTTKELFPGLSTDGSHILMTTKGVTPCETCATPVHLYMRVDDRVTYEIAGGNAVNYIGMTSDGTKVFFTSDLQLTPDDHDSSTDLYMWSEKGEEEGEPLTRLSAGSGGTGDTDECAAAWIDKCGVSPVEGAFETDYPIASQSGDIYFYSPELLDGPDKGVEGARNLYVYRNGAPRFVTRLNVDGSDPLTRIQISPDGDHAAFVTASQITGYENAEKTEMYSFDPESGSVICVSCLPSGNPPTANVSGSISGFFMSNDGRPFFSTRDPLVARDTNNGVDVYEYADGRPQLISSGTGDPHFKSNHKENPVALMGVSVDGKDIYFSSYDKLVAQDQNGAFLKFYDARTDGGFPVSPGALPCEAADECHGPGTSPPPPAAITSDQTLGNGGNVVRHRHRRTRHARHHRHHRRGHDNRHGGPTHG